MVSAPPAQAFAAKTTCLTTFYNGLGTGGNVRLVSWTPVNFLSTSPSVPQALIVYGGVGVPTGSTGVISETGYFLPFYGCHGTLVFTSSVGLLSCAYSDPSSGRNHFSCGGPASTYVTIKWLRDGNTMAICVGFGAQCASSAADAEAAAAARTAAVRPPPPSPKLTENSVARKTLLRQSDLRGRWRSTHKLTADMLRLDRTLAASQTPRACESNSKTADPSASGIASVLYGSKSAGNAWSVVAYYKDGRATTHTFNDLASAHTRFCLTALLRGGKRLRARTTVAALSSAGLPTGSTRYRITIRYTRGPVGYLDFAAVRGRRGWSALAFYREGRPVSSEVSTPAIFKVAARLR